MAEHHKKLFSLKRPHYLFVSLEDDQKYFVFLKKIIKSKFSVEKSSKVFFLKRWTKLIFLHRLIKSNFYLVDDQKFLTKDSSIGFFFFPMILPFMRNRSHLSSEVIVLGSWPSIWKKTNRFCKYLSCFMRNRVLTSKIKSSKIYLKANDVMMM